eukprot:s184_g13.t1
MGWSHPAKGAPTPLVLDQHTSPATPQYTKLNRAVKQSKNRRASGKDVFVFLPSAQPTMSPKCLEMVGGVPCKTWQVKLQDL